MSAKYIVRLDDACPQMNHDNWHRMEDLLDKYHVKPLVGIIPDNQDPEFNWPEDECFWERALNWQAKGWTIAQHGYHHSYLPEAKRKYYQKSHSLHTEWAGVDKEEQKKMMLKGYKLLSSHGLYPTGFFAPAHTFDENTVAACKEITQMKFISDGYGLFPYKKSEMTFIPSICDGPFQLKIPGIYTFVAHPSFMEEKNFKCWEEFFYHKKNDMTTVSDALKIINTKQGMVGKVLEWVIYLAREMRKK